MSKVWRDVLWKQHVACIGAGEPGPLGIFMNPYSLQNMSRQWHAVRRVRSRERPIGMRDMGARRYPVAVHEPSNRERSGLSTCRMG